MAEEMFRAGLPFCVVDPVGAWWGLRAGGHVTVETGEMITEKGVAAINRVSKGCFNLAGAIKAQ